MLGQIVTIEKLKGELFAELIVTSDACFNLRAF